MAKCAICTREVSIRQTWSQCGKNFGPECRSQFGGGRPICESCGG